MDTELALIKYIRKSNFQKKEVEIRLDANGAFTPKEAIEKLNRLTELNISYIEQTDKGRAMARNGKIVENSPIKLP